MIAALQKGQRAAILAAACLTPLIVKLTYVNLEDGFRLLGYADPIPDGFSWYKSVFVSVCAALALILTVISRNWRATDFQDRALLSLAVLSAASVICSPYRTLGIWGVPFLFEGLHTFFAYLALMFSASRCGLKTADLLAICLAWTTIVIASIALPEEKGIFILNIPWIADLLLALPGELRGIYSGQFYSAAVLPFGNPNYVGVFAAMVWPFMVGKSWTRQTANSMYFYAATSGLALALLLGSRSRMGLVSGAIAVFICSAIAVIKLPTKRHHYLVSLFSLGLGIGLNGYFSPWSPVKRIASIGVGAFPVDIADDDPDSEDSLSLVNGRLRITQGDAVLLIERLLDALKFMDGNYRPLTFRLNLNEIIFDDSAYAVFKIKNTRLANFPALEINGSTAVITGRGFRIQRLGALIIPILGTSLKLPFSTKAFSKRGFIWSRSLPLLADKWILGHGPGAFPFEFPNADVKSMLREFNSHSIVDKPHNFYISLAFSYGILALVIVILVFVRILKASGRLAVVGNRESSSKILPYFAGILGFMLASFLNDSTVGVSAPFWVMLGLTSGILRQAQGTLMHLK